MNTRILLSHLLVCSALVLSACDSGTDAAKENGRTSILDGKASVVIPEGYSKMSKEMLAEKYPHPATRPTEGWYVAKENGKVTLAFNLTSSPITIAQLPTFAGMMKMQLKAFKPEVVEGFVSGEKVQRLEMITPDATDPDGGIYNMLQFSSRENRLLISTFNTTVDLKDHYAGDGVKALSSLKY